MEPPPAWLSTIWSKLSARKYVRTIPLSLFGIIGNIEIFSSKLLCSHSLCRFHFTSRFVIYAMTHLLLISTTIFFQNILCKQRAKKKMFCRYFLSFCYTIYHVYCTRLYQTLNTATYAMFCWF